MKKFLVLIILCFCMNLAVLADDTPQIPNQDAKQQLMNEWLQSHPDKAKELKEILSTAQNPEAALEQWLEANPDCTQQLENLVMPEGNGQ